MMESRDSTFIGRGKPHAEIRAVVARRHARHRARCDGAGARAEDGRPEDAVRDRAHRQPEPRAVQPDPGRARDRQGRAHRRRTQARTARSTCRPTGRRSRRSQTARLAAVAATEKKAAQAFLDKAAAEKGATKTPSGIVVTTIKPGTGASPKATDKVKVHYQGTLTDGTVFDSSVQRNQPATFPLNGVIKCWTEGVQLMKVGGKSKLVCPSDLAYGDQAARRRRSSPAPRWSSRSSCSRS